VNELGERITNEKSTISRRDTNHYVAKPGCSPLSKLLLYPSSNNQKKPQNYAVHVLTSSESIAWLEEKV